MARYVIGDIQGCFEELQQLLGLLEFSPGKDHLYLLGDLVNRGPDSLGVLRWVFENRQSVSTVLGNHDLHLLACAASVTEPGRQDTFDDILRADDANTLLDWLRMQPLLIGLDDALLVHAGILPAWDEAMALARANEVNGALCGAGYKEMLSQMYGNKPRRWSESLSFIERTRLSINVFTRMRMVDETGALDFKYKGELPDAPDHLCAWFDFPHRAFIGKRIFCGHWSALGLYSNASISALDAGCVWGGQLVAVCLDDDQVYQVQAKRPYQSVDV